MPWKMEIFIDNPVFEFDIDFDMDRFDLPYRERLSFFRHGSKIPAKFWPLEFVQRDEKDRYPDLFQGHTFGKMIVSKRMREIIQSFEGDRHVFVPITITRTDCKEGPKDYTFLNVVELIDSVLAGQSDVAPQYNRREELCWYSSPICANYTFDKSVVGDRHLWVEKYLKNDVFISDQLRAALMAADVNGVSTIETYFF